MSQIINISTDLIKFRSNDGIAEYYLPVNKNLHFIRKGDNVVLWSNKTGKKGIYGYGKIVTDILKPSELSEDVYDRNNLQVGVIFNQINFVQPIIPENLAYKLPSLNESKQPVIISNSLNYWGNRIIKEVKTFTEDYNHIFSFFGKAEN